MQQRTPASGEYRRHQRSSLASHFRKERPVTVQLLVVLENEINTTIAHALGCLEDPGIVVIGT
jgi:hypothetical protein